MCMALLLVCISVLSLLWSYSSDADIQRCVLMARSMTRSMNLTLSGPPLTTLLYWRTLASRCSWIGSASDCAWLRLYLHSCPWIFVYTYLLPTRHTVNDYWRNLIHPGHLEGVQHEQETAHGDGVPLKDCRTALLGSLYCCLLEQFGCVWL